METFFNYFKSFFLVLVTFFNLVYGQDEFKINTNIIKSGVNFDIANCYIWRGTKYATGPVIQPNIALSNDNFSLGVWGCYDFNNFSEADFYINYRFSFGLSFGITDYYFPLNNYFSYSKDSGNHAFEINAGYELKNFTISANYIINKANRIGSYGNDKYFQIEYKNNKIFSSIGFGDGWHTSNNKIKICNITLGIIQTMNINSEFYLPLKGMLILNPDRKYLNMLIMISF